MSDSEGGYSDVEEEEKEKQHFKREAPQSSTLTNSYYHRTDNYKNKYARFSHQSTKTYEPKIEVEFMGVEEGHKFDFNSEEIKFAFDGNIIELYTDEDDDVRFDHFVIPYGIDIYPKSNFALFDSTLVENLAKENITTMRPSQIATMMAAFFSAPSTATKPPDLICISSTGSGKTIAYLIPMIQKCITRIGKNPDLIRRPPTVFIFAHSNTLVVNIYQKAKKLADETGVKIELITGGTKFLKNTYFDIGICTIGRFLGHTEDVREGDVEFNIDDLKYLIVDEADLMSIDNEFRKIVDRLKLKQKDLQTFLFSATINNTVYSLIDEKNCYSFAGGKINEAAGSIKQFFWPVSTTALSKISGVYNGTLNIGKYEEPELRHPFDALFHFLQLKKFDKPSNKKKVIVFMKKTIVADIIAKKLNIFGFPAVSVHGKQLFRVRQKLLQKFIDGEVQILFATNLLTRGTDIDVQYVINYDLPEDYANWVHRCGRTGRNGKIGVAITFIDKENTSDYPILTLQQIALHANMENAPDFMKDFAEYAKMQREMNNEREDQNLLEDD